MFGSVFIRSESTFSGRQQIRERYQELADTLRDIVHLVPDRMRPAIQRYLNHVSDVIARGAIAADVAEFEAKLDEWTETEKSLIASMPSPPVAIGITPGLTTRKRALVEPALTTGTAGQYLEKLSDVNSLLIIGVAVGLMFLLKR